MKAIKPYTEIVNFEGDPLKHIELCGRVCYKSEDKITSESALGLIKNIIARGHESVLEHFRVVVEVPVGKIEYEICKELQVYDSVEVSTGVNGDLLSGNIRAFRDMVRDSKRNFIVESVAHTYPALFKDLKDLTMREFDELNVFPAESYMYVSDHEYFVHCPKTVRFTCDRGVSHEKVRHRKSSFSQESTRFCNYSAEKFDSQITVIDIIPIMNDMLGKTVVDPKTKESHVITVENISVWISNWIDACEVAEHSYLNMVNNWCPAQLARSVLNNSTKTEIMVTKTFKWWNHFFKLRTVPDAHPQMRELAIPLYAQFKKEFPRVRGYLV